MQQVSDTAERIAPTELSVIIVGEQGTGKERLARWIHSSSPRSGGPFTIVDCGALNEGQIEDELFGVELLTWEGITIKSGILEESAEGTLLLDEFQFVPVDLQVRFARAVEYKSIVRRGGTTMISVNPRIIATMTLPRRRDRRESLLADEIHHRLNPVLINLPPLRERREDIPELISWFIRQVRETRNVPVQGISDEAIRCCLEFEWPGNVRHLKNAIEYASVMSKGGTIVPSHLPEYVAKVVEKL